MDFEQILTLLGQQAFPIVAYILLFRYTIAKDNSFTSQISELDKVIDNNTKAITILCERFDKNDK